MSDFSDNRMRESMARAQRQYDNQMPPDDDDYRECDECGDEYDVERDNEGDPIHTTCEKCRKFKEDQEK